MKQILPENLIMFCDDHWNNLLPLTYTRPVCELRTGILTIREKWEIECKGNGSHITQDFLSEKFTLQIKEDNLLINSTFLPDKELIRYVYQLQNNEALVWGDELIVARISGALLSDSDISRSFSQLKKIDLSLGADVHLNRITRPYHIFTLNGAEIIEDYNRLTSGRSSASLSPTNRIIGDYPVFAEKGAVAECAIFNTTKGPVYLGENSVVMEGAVVRGPFALCEGAMVKIGAKIYEDTTIGPFSKAGGEINNAVMMANSNKSHDGYLGNSVIGEWCNLGADTNSSNLKNNYLPVKIWSYVKESFEDTGLQFCGLIMGDHSKTGINTMLNTGTVVGVAANIFGDGFPRNFVPSFSWGGASGFITHQLSKALETATIVMKRRGVVLKEADQKIFEYIFNHSATYRLWEKK